MSLMKIWRPLWEPLISKEPMITGREKVLNFNSGTQQANRNFEQLLRYTIKMQEQQSQCMTSQIVNHSKAQKFGCKNQNKKDLKIQWQRSQEIRQIYQIKQSLLCRLRNSRNSIMLYLSQQVQNRTKVLKNYSIPLPPKSRIRSQIRKARELKKKLLNQIRNVVDMYGYQVQDLCRMLLQIQSVYKIWSISYGFGVVPFSRQVRCQPLKKMIEWADFQALGASIQGEVDGFVRFACAVVDLKFNFHDQHQQYKLEHCFGQHRFANNAKLQKMIKDQEKLTMRLKHNKILNSINPQALRISKKQNNGYLIQVLILGVQVEPAQVQVEGQYLTMGKPTERILNPKTNKDPEKQDSIKQKAQHQQILGQIVKAQDSVQTYLEQC